ncbi:MAG: PGF-pre-PGF domain-containing protein [Candidatus Pacearchaeota archaeon]
MTIGLNVSNVSNSANFTVKFTLNSSATYNVTVGANVTGIGNGSYDTLTGLQFSALPYNSSLATIDESTNPTATATCTKDTYASQAFPCTCSGTDSGVTDSGVASSTGTSNSPEGTNIPVTIGTFTYTCAVTDNAGNTASDTETYTILATGGRSSTGPSNPERKHSWTKITPGAAIIMKDFSNEFGIKQIEITVNNEAQNVKITVTKYDGKPAEVSVSKSGKVYQYMQIDAENLEGNLDKATVQFKVEKSWASSNNLGKDEIAVYKFDESNSKWNQLSTSYASEDTLYYYYNVKLTSFSYFAIAEETTTATGDEGTIDDGTGAVAGKSGNTWLWVLVIAVVLIALWYFMKRKRR